MPQFIYNQCVIAFKQISKQAFDKNSWMEQVHKADGTIYVRSGKNRSLDEIISPIAKDFCKPFKKLV
ncbi:hypothetical protein LCGC14_2351230 [marine sediment metagenome]|uniref:Uncharacterized protein n=1 Tax=marine sediment metagenome TaxID=412755 RepID=A0A0F9C9R7_9ZZZZ